MDVDLMFPFAVVVGIFIFNFVVINCQIKFNPVLKIKQLYSRVAPRNPFVFITSKILVYVKDETV